MPLSRISLAASTLLIASVATADAEMNPCELFDAGSDAVSHQAEGTVPHWNGQLGYDSRRQRKNGRMQFIWSVTENSSGYTAEIAWGSSSKETEYFGGLVKHGISTPRCKAKGSRRDAEVADRVFKFRRPLYSWDADDVETVLRSASLDTPRQRITLDDIFSIFVGTATAQTASDITRMEQEALNGTLPEALRPYFEIELGLDVQGVISDPEALEAYTEGGYEPLAEWSFTVTDLPNTPGALERLGSEAGIDPSELSPTLFSIVTVLEPSDGEYEVNYFVRARVLNLEGEPTKHDPGAFLEVGYSPSFVTPNEELNALLEGVVLENTNGNFISSVPGSSEAIRVSSFRSNNFSSVEDGSLIVRAGEFSFSVLDFAVLLPEG